MGGFSPSLMKLWKEWNVRVTVLLSLMIQVVLIGLGKRRKYDSRLWIRIVTWCAYLSADFIATYALGVITNNMSRFHEKNCGVMGANTELTAFWAPFLLMHLGGPDTITAYSLEDNELWLRHLLGFAVQMVMAIYVCVMAWTGSLLSFLSLLMLFAGFIKYGERSWVLRKASIDKIRESYAHLSQFKVSSTLRELEKFHDHILFKANFLMDISVQPLFLDLSLSYMLRLLKTHINFSASSVEDSIQIIEVSLAFIYNILYTKAFLLYTYVGLGLRVICVILTFSVSVIFPVLILKHKFSKIDVTITFILLFGAIILDIYSALLLLVSDRFQFWLKKHPKCLIMFEAFRGVLPKQKRWSNKMSQLSLLSFIIKEKPLPCCNFMKHFSIVEKLESQWYTADIEIPNGLKKLILDYLKAKRDQTTQSESSDIENPNEIPNDSSDIDFSEVPNDLKNLFVTYVESKRDQTKRDQIDPRDSLNIDVDGVDFTKELEKSIIAWHLATEKWYEMDRKDFEGKEDDIESIYQISRYMLSLLVLHPSMLSNANTTTFTIQPILVAARGVPKFTSKIEACQDILKLLNYTESKIKDPSLNLEGLDSSTYVFFSEDLPKFLQQLGEQDWEERWRMISCTWLEMLAYTAYKCKGIQHAQQLRCGGEFLTHVWFFIKFLGFIEEDFKLHAPRWASSIIGFGDASSSRHDSFGVNESDTSSIIGVGGASSLRMSQEKSFFSFSLQASCPAAYSEQYIPILASTQVAGPCGVIALLMESPLERLDQSFQQLLERLVGLEATHKSSTSAPQSKSIKRKH